MNFNFQSFYGKYKNLDEKGIDILNGFFSDPEVQKIIEKIEEQRKKKLKILLGIGGLVLILISLFFPKGQEVLPMLIIFIYLMLFFGTFIVLIVNGVCKYLWGDGAKDTLLPMFVKKIEPQMVYAKTPPDGTWNIAFLTDCIANKMIQPYMRLDRFEDTITYNIQNEAGEKSIQLQGVELKTSVRTGGKNKSRHTNNHGYMMKIKFFNPKYTLKKEIHLKQDFNDRVFVKMGISLGITILLSVLGLIFFAPSKTVNGKTEVDTSTYFANITPTSEIFWGLTLLLIFGSIFAIINYVSGRNRVKMENLDFEKRFDVYCADPEEARILLTPSFMYRILDYINHIDTKRVYTFYFKEDYFYVKYDLRASHKYSYMEVSSLRSVEKSLDDYVKFYLEIKGIKELITDLKLFYFDKGMFDTQIIKH